MDWAIKGVRFSVLADMTVDRYNTACAMWMCGATQDMVMDPEGKWVRLQDYLALEQELARIEALLQERSSDVTSSN